MSLDSKNAANKTKNESVENELQILKKIQKNQPCVFFLFLQLIDLTQKMVLNPI